MPHPQFNPESPMTVLNEQCGIIVVPDTPEALAQAGIVVPVRHWPEAEWSPIDQRITPNRMPPHNRLVLALTGPLPHLTPSEKEVMVRHARGEPMKVIALTSLRSRDTIKTHAWHAREKLDAQSSTLVTTKLILGGEISVEPARMPVSLGWHSVGILLLTACGMTNAAIAPRVGMETGHGVSNALTRTIGPRVGFSTRFEAPRQAFNRGILIRGVLMPRALAEETGGSP